MTGPLSLLLVNAVAAGLIALVAWAASRRLKRQTLVHALWVVALVKLVTPPIVPLPMLPEWTWPSLDIGGGPAIVVIEAGAGQAPLAAGESVRPAPPPPNDEITALPSAPAPGIESAMGGALQAGGPATVVGTRAEGRWPLPTTLAWWTLLAGALAVATLAGRRIVRFRRLLRHTVPAPPPLGDRVSELAARIGLRRAPEVRLLPARVPPMLWPSRRGPLLLMPEGLLPKLTSEERDTLLVHELAHVHRRDHWVRLLELAVTVVFWWYPVTWWVRRALRRAEERCCDEWVLRLMPTSAPAYAEGLLKSLDHAAGEPDPLPVGASGAGPVHDLETRLKEILIMTRPTPNLGTPARVALSVLAVLGLAVFPTQAQSPAPAEPGASESTPPLSPTPPKAPSLASSAPLAAVPDSPAPEGAPALPAGPTPAVAIPAVAPPSPAIPVPPTPPHPIAALPLLSAVPGPVVAPGPAPHPIVDPAPGVVSPVPMPASMPSPRPALAQAGSPEEEAELRATREQQRVLDVQRRELHQIELRMVRERMARQSLADQKHMRAEVERLRAAGEAERARLVEEHARTMAERAELRQRELELEQSRIASQSGRDTELRRASERLRTLEHEGRQGEADAVQAGLARLEREYAREQLEVEKERLALQREAMEVNYRAQAAEMELARAMADRDHEAMEADVERATRRQASERALRQRELAAREAEQSLRAVELALAGRDAAGEHPEAEALRSEAEEKRRHLDALHRGIQEEHLLRASSDLEMQMQSQLEALRHIEADGAADSAKVQKEIGRLEAALDAMRAAGE